MFKIASFILISFVITSCSIVEGNANKLSCDTLEIDCYRFNYKSLEGFKESVNTYSVKWSLSNPKDILPKIKNTQNINITTLDGGVSLIKSNPEYIYALGQYIENKNISREWLFLSEQEFIRIWNHLGR